MTRWTGSARTVAFRLGLFAILVGTVSIAAEPARADEEGLADHLTLLGELSRSAAKDLIGQLGFPPGSDVYLLAETDHPANWFVAQQLARTLREAGYGVFHPGLGAGPAGREAIAGGAGQTAQDAQAEANGAQAKAGGKQAGPAAADSDEPEEAAIGDSAEDGADAGSGDDDNGTGDDGADADSDDQAADGDDDSAQQDNQGAGQPDAQGAGGQNQAAKGQGQKQAQGQPAAQGPAVRPVPKELELDFPATGEVCVFRVVECGVSYPWVRRSWLIGPRTYGRYASIKLRGSRLSQPGKRVASVGSSDQVRIDKFPGWARPYLEGDEYPFHLDQPSGLAIERVVEPVVVVAIVAGLVYLFNQNQK